MANARIFSSLILGLAVAGCQATAMNSRVTVDTGDGQALPQATITGGASQSTLTRSITVPSGKSTKLQFFAFTNPDCTNVGYATVRPVVSPANGALEFREVEDFGYWPEKNPRAECNKKRVKGVAVRYVPKAGFTGIDTVVYEAFGPSSGLRRYSLTVNVL